MSGRGMTKLNGTWSITEFAGSVGVRTLFMAAAIVLASCQNSPFAKKDPNMIPEAMHPDWKTLRALVNDYNASIADIEHKGSIIAQTHFRDLAGNHGGDRIGDEALYYVGRIFYDMRAYHDARVIFAQHKEKFRASEFTATIDTLEKQMAQTDSEYKQWLDANRTTTSINK